MRKFSMILLAAIVLTSCVSKKKYLALEHENGEIKSELTKTRVEKEDLESKFAAIQERVDAYNNKINTLTSLNSTLNEENDSKMETVADVAVISNNTKAKMRETLEKVDPTLVSQAKTLKDSMDLAISYNLKSKMSSSSFNEDDDIAVSIDETVVMISISDKMLFNTGSYRVSNKANGILQKLADVINSEPSIDVMVEGHTDSRSINTEKIQDNWDLSVLRATSVVRKLQNKYNVAPEKLIASGRSSYQPLASNDTRDGRSKNRRTRIIILPNIDKFFALMESDK
ncbi:OmpA family protein [Oceanihabitans sediminis]|uniref:Cell envelope biogenesis protein OmpA n=1 Tax=Oceanihabitans sediminis TaxID=1812012 RepID=A0A368P6I9_9FLAO|nr:OmpA family protein [Oceanihabitans sediminis]MDX1277227.1 OmpA family protein [Oceanihabitans sediminis]RCU57399.1 cell envelope biogenesis protein OmpA [Oceanihabitans sediminis]